MIEINGYPPTKTTPWPHQEDAWNLAKHHTGFMYGHDMGCGKSKSAVDYCNGMDANIVLVVCPNAVVSDVWREQFETHSAKTYRIVELNNSSIKKKAENLEQQIRISIATKIPLVVVINFESIWREPLGPSYNSYGKLTASGLMVRQPWDIIIVDESQKIKGYKSTISKYMHQLGIKTKHKLCLSGTFIDDKPEDVFGQYRFLDDTIYGTSYTAFKTRYMDQIQVGPYSKTVSYKNIDEYNTKLRSISHHVLKRDVLTNLPPVTPITYKCRLCDKARKIYDKFKDDFVVEVDNEILSTQTIVVKLLRLAQIAGGYLPLEDPDGVVRDKGQIVDVSKIEKLEYIMDSVQANEPIVVFCRFTKELERIKKAFELKSRSCAELSGNKNELAEWKAGKFNSIAVQIKSGAAGISLVRSCIGVYYSKGYSLGEYNQSTARLDRPGQTRPVTLYYLDAANTMDDVIAEAIEAKKEIVNYVINYHKNQHKPNYIKVA